MSYKTNIKYYIRSNFNQQKDSLKNQTLSLNGGQEINEINELKPIDNFIEKENFKETLKIDESLNKETKYNFKNLEEPIGIREAKYREIRKESKLIFIDKPKEIEKNNKIGIIVPYRDNIIQNRKSQLIKFLTYFRSYLKGFNYKIFIIEQSNDDNKFNRGKLLNIGIKIALEEGFNNFITHDVDLLPDYDLKPFYTNTFDIPIHIAHSFEKYNYDRYFGGIVSFNTNLIDKFNGYPNDFWGWGGEDDALYDRIAETIGIIGKPSIGKVNELYHDDTPKEDKNQTLRNNILSDFGNWNNNGINNLIYKIIQRDNFGKINKIKVNIT